ncbi:MAG: hypothetical protein AB7O88_20405 [Reyranellaceae bacterium]
MLTFLSLPVTACAGRTYRNDPYERCRFERREQRSVCAAPDRLAFLPLAGDNRSVVLVVRGE